MITVEPQEHQQQELVSIIKTWIEVNNNDISSCDKYDGYSSSSNVSSMSLSSENNDRDTIIGLNEIIKQKEKENKELLLELQIMNEKEKEEIIKRKDKEKEELLLELQIMKEEKEKEKEKLKDILLELQKRNTRTEKTENTGTCKFSTSIYLYILHMMTCQLLYSMLITIHHLYLIFHHYLIQVTQLLLHFKKSKI